MAFVYQLKSLKDSKKYIGSTSNLLKRLKQHNSGKVISTKKRRPLILLGFQKCENIQEAAKKGHFATSGDVFTDIYSAIPYDDEEPQTNEQESEAEADKSEEKQTATGA